MPGEVPRSEGNWQGLVWDFCLTAPSRCPPKILAGGNLSRLFVFCS